eukprot:gene15471-4649_t
MREIKKPERYIKHFLKRCNLSIRSIKRSRKFSKDEIKEKLKSFHQFLRTQSRGIGLPANSGMGRFHKDRVTNMDESPWAIDQRGQMTVEVVLSTSSGDNPMRVKPMILFKGTGSKIKAEEKREYDKGVAVAFNEKAFMNTETFVNKWIPHYLAAWQGCGSGRLLVMDSASSHLSDASLKAVRDAHATAAVIPGGCTMYAQHLDTHVFSRMKAAYNDCVDEFTAECCAKNKNKVQTFKPSHLRVLVTRWVARACAKVMADMPVNDHYRTLGYTWTDSADKDIKIRDLDDYRFEDDGSDPTAPKSDSEQKNAKKEVAKDAKNAKADLAAATSSQRPQ